MKLINMTPHAVTIETDGGRITLPPSGTVPRVAEVVTAADTITLASGETIATAVAAPGEVTGLPALADGVMIIVSAMVLAAAVDRTDLVAPDTGPESAIRDEAGRIVAVRRLRRK